MNMLKNISTFLACLFLATGVAGQSLPALESARIHLPNGWSLTPAGKSLGLGDLPLNMVFSRSGSRLAVTNNGQSDQTIFLIDPQKEVVLDTILIGKSWLGLAFGEDENTLYASGGNDNWILEYKIFNNHLVPADTFKLGKPWPVKISPAGIAVDDKKHLLYVVTKENNSLYIVDLLKKKPLQRVDLGGEGYTCLLSHDRKILYISCWGCGKVLFFNTRTLQFEEPVIVGSNPNDLCLSRNGKYLYVANANDNSVSVISLEQHKVIETLDAALFPGAPEGCTTNSVALSEDDRTLYIANADNNCLAVFDVTNPGMSRSKGFIPTGWYPTCVRVKQHRIFVANGKGFTSMANPLGPSPVKPEEKIDYQKGLLPGQIRVQYIAGLFRGKLSIIPEPDDAQMSIFSQATYHNTPYSKEKEASPAGSPGNPVPIKAGDHSPIKYVFYIIKENRTYDQILGDLQGGNGDTSLVLFGRKYTPNQHELATQFVLLDNFYVDGEVSADGHNWSMGAYATDYLEKTWPTSYGDRGGEYDAEGTRNIANNKNGFIWDLCQRNGVSYRTYGEFADDYKPNIPVLKDHYCRYYTSWDQSVYDTVRFHQWKRDFDSLLAIGKLPQLNTLRFINDHTQGLRAGKRTPFAQVADNDLAVGMFVEYLSHSSIWNECAIFIVEDDAQNGPDHVDAHRSPVYLAGGFVKREFIDHTQYSTSSVLRTIELILGLPPMSQYDAAAESMWRCFDTVARPSEFHTVGPFVNLDERNKKLGYWQKVSEDFNFAKEDRAPEDLLNKVLWVAVKGEGVPCPAPRHSAFVQTQSAK